MTMTWYDTLDDEIRPYVKALRDNGINTTQSCGHLMWIRVLWGDPADMVAIFDLFDGMGMTPVEMTFRNDRGGRYATIRLPSYLTTQEYEEPVRGLWSEDMGRVIHHKMSVSCANCGHTRVFVNQHLAPDPSATLLLDGWHHRGPHGNRTDIWWCPRCTFVAGVDANPAGELLARCWRWMPHPSRWRSRSE